LLYPTLVYAAIKKSGKTGFAALLVPTLLLLFGGRYGEAFCIANDLEQAKGRVFEAIKRIVQASPLLADEADITQNKITFAATGSTITAVPSDYTGAAGVNPVISVFDELWGFTSEKAWRLWDEFVPSPARKISCRLVVTHAGFSGESELLEDLCGRGLNQPQVGTDLHAGNGLLCFWSHVPIASWQTDAWIEQMRGSLRPHQFLRMIENRFTTNEETFIDPAWWDACAIARPVVADPSMSVWVGVDASHKRDSTGIAVFTWDRSAKCPRLVWHKIFQPSTKDPLDFEGTIEETLLGLKARFRVRQVFFDPWQMASTAQRLQRAGLNMVEFNQTLPKLMQASQNLYELIKAQNLIVYPDDEIRIAISRAIAVENTRGWRIDKSKQSHKIDIVVAMGMAALGTVQKGGAQILINGRTPEEDKQHMAWAATLRPGTARRVPPRPEPSNIRLRPVSEQDIEKEGIRLKW
jgi:phage terminase large subunit-like protein